MERNSQGCGYALEMQKNAYDEESRIFSPYAEKVKEQK